MPTSSSADLHNLFKRVRETHLPVMPAATAKKKKLERQAIAEKVQDYFRRKFIREPDREALCSVLFGCQVWPTEELLLEDLVRAKMDGHAERIAFLRDLIHANSWSSHLAHSHDDLISQIHRLQHVFQKENVPPERIRQQGTRALDEHAHQGEVILDALRQHIDGDRAEAATRAIEVWMDEAWEQFRLIKRSMPFAWAQVKTLRKTRPQLRIILKRIEELREVRDQLYVQRLYPVLFREGKEPPHHAV